MIRRARLLVLGAVAAVLLTGCGVEPGRAGAAAIVGGTRIPVAEVQSWMREAFAQDPDLEQRLQQQGRLDDSAREIAGHLVKQELVEQVAQRCAAAGVCGRGIGHGGELGAGQVVAVHGQEGRDARSGGQGWVLFVVELIDPLRDFCGEGCFACGCLVSRRVQVWKLSTSLHVPT